MRLMTAGAAAVAATVALAACGDPGGSASELPEGWVEGGDDERELAQNAAELASGTDVEVVSVYIDERTAGSGFATNVNVISEEVSDDVDLAEYEEIALEGLRKGGFEGVEAAGDGEIAGEEARFVEYAAPEDSPVQIKVQLAIVIRDDTGYAFTLTAANDEFDAASRDFDEILRNWEWSD